MRGLRVAPPDALSCRIADAAVTGKLLVTREEYRRLSSGEAANPWAPTPEAMFAIGRLGDLTAIRIFITDRPIPPASGQVRAAEVAQQRMEEAFRRAAAGARSDPWFLEHLVAASLCDPRDVLRLTSI